MILVRLMGGMGNQMFQYAAARALAEKNKTLVKLDLDVLLDRTPTPNMMRFFDYELHVFNSQQNFATVKEKYYFMPFTKNVLKRVFNKIRFAISPRRFYKQPNDNYDNSFLNLPDNYCIEGRFQSEKYFKPYEDIIRKEFKFNINLPEGAKKIENQILNTNSIGIQVRRGDYVYNPHFNNMLGTKDLSYYENGIELITKGDKNFHIYVISDDIPWCIENLKFNYPTTYLSDELVSPNHHVQLYLLSCCKHFVISNSTFAWWGAWLSSSINKIVVAPEIWFADRTINDKDVVPESWIKI